MCIHIAGGNIESVTPMSTKEFESLADKDDIDTLNLGSYLLTPTFTNAHTHLAMSAFRGLQTNAFGGNVVEDLYYQIESKLTAEDVKAFARFAAYEAILAGTGMVWDHYYFGASMAEGLAEAGLPAVIAPTLQDIHGTGRAYLGRTTTNDTRIEFARVANARYLVSVRTTRDRYGQ